MVKELKIVQPLNLKRKSLNQILLNPVLNCSKSLLSFSVDKATTGTHNFVSVIWNDAFVGAFTAGLAGLPPRAALAVFVLISVKTQFSTKLKSEILHN